MIDLGTLCDRRATLTRWARTPRTTFCGPVEVRTLHGPAKCVAYEAGQSDV